MLTYDCFDTPIGQLTVVKSTKGVCFIGLPGTSLAEAEKWARRHFPGEILKPASAPFEIERRQLLEYARGEWRQFTFLIDHRNTPGSVKFLEEVQKIPFGETATYGEIALRTGRPKAARAVGRAMATNPLPLVLPCHRIVGSDGSLTGYGGGISLKKQLLHMESGNV
jgi:O-6-methylguanine DNA methyltransferase